MPEARKIGLDNPVFSGRLRTSRRSYTERRPVVAAARTAVGDVRRVRPVAAAPHPVAAPSKPAVSKPSIRPTAVPKAKLVSGPKAPPSQPRPHKSQVLRREAFVGRMPLPEPPSAPPRKTKKKASRRKRTGIMMAALAILLFVCGMGIGALQLNTNQKVEAQVQALSRQPQDEEGGAEVPSETDAPNVDAYQVAAEMPRVITIPKLNVKARIVPVGVKETTNEIIAPTNIFDAGWYNATARPGQQGAMFIDGHVHGPTKPGVFNKLNQLKPGDAITVESGDGQKFTYRVVTSQSYDKDKLDMGMALSPIDRNVPGLNLITCDGTYDASGHYANRLVVFASLEN